MGLAPDAPIPACEVRLGTTLATNALLERGGDPTALVITRGFADLVRVGDQARRDLFALNVTTPEPLHCDVLEVDARVSATGKLLAQPDEARLTDDLRALRHRGARAVAIVVIHAYTSEAQRLERRIGACALEAGFAPGSVCLSHQISSTQGLLARAETCLVDAYLTPKLQRHLGKLQQQLPGSRLQLLTSSGALVAPKAFRGHRAIVSGPAGGVVACHALATALDLDQVVGFDMGGTSTDVSRVARREPPAKVFESTVGGVRVRAPMISIHTVAAGGGSLCRFDGHRLTVGPASAGAVPGPICYGHPEATELTLTDISLLLGRVRGDRFPFKLHRQKAQQTLADMAASLPETSPEQLAAGFLAVAVASMAAAIARVSTARGYDVREHAMIVFGGAGGQYACAVARELGIKKLVFHPLAGLFSAVGIGLSRVGWDDVRDAGRKLLGHATMPGFAELARALEADGRTQIRQDTDAEDGWLLAEQYLDLRYQGTESTLSVAWEDDEDASAVAQRFAVAHHRLYGYVRRDHPIEVVNVRVTLTVLRTTGKLPREIRVMGEEPPTAEQEGCTRARVFAGDRFYADVPVWRRESLTEATTLDGPALILEATSTIVLEPGWRLCVDATGSLLATDHGVAEADVANKDVSAISLSGGDRAQAPDPVLLEVIGNRIMTIAEQMGVVLQRTALSTNIRERLDFSCAVFDRHGELVANAPHIPVHLGAMGESVRGVIAAYPKLQVGQVYATNDPGAGGSHLPDITVVTPVFDDAGNVEFFTASRGHHADVGGVTPGSMPPYAESLAEEGVCLQAVPLLRDGEFDRDHLRALLTAGPYPARNPGENLADLEAQIAANRTGARLLRTMVDDLGGDTVASYMMHIQDFAAACVHRAIAELPDGTRRFVDAMDDGTAIAVALTVKGDRLAIDFTGTGAQVRGNLNAPTAVTRAAVLYVLRLLAGQPMPLNSGCMRPVELHIPPGCLLAPSPGKAVAAGNVETAQRVVDVLLGALELAAASQGTMNNLTFGQQGFGYYETIGGGAGATATMAGANGVHTHMTNTRITDAEVLESRFPVRLLEFSLRRGSGGHGRHRGGDGLVRAFEFLQPVEISLLSQRRSATPFGLRGGGCGQSGVNRVDGEVVPGHWQGSVSAGGRVRIETPGGGGFGE